MMDVMDSRRDPAVVARERLDVLALLATARHARARSPAAQPAARALGIASARLSAATSPPSAHRR
jgi:hypothetical protein